VTGQARANAWTAGATCSNPILFLETAPPNDLNAY
jgi:hypothetical protein